MIKRATTLGLASGLALALAGCGGSGDADAKKSEEIAPDMVLTPIQQGNFDRYDKKETEKEYAKDREEIRAEAEKSGGDSAAANTDGMKPRDQMTFDWLDRDKSGNLSIAEWALWKIPADQVKGKPGDPNEPYLTPDQLDEAARTFFHYDVDGSLDLSKEEFSKAVEQETGGQKTGDQQSDSQKDPDQT